MVRRDSGHIINIGSVGEKWQIPRNAIYSAAKGAVRIFSESLRLDLIGTQIRMTVLEPGLVDTPLLDRRFGQKADLMFRGISLLEAKDVAEAVCWCLSRPPHVNIQEMTITPVQQTANGISSMPRS